MHIGVQSIPQIGKCHRLHGTDEIDHRARKSSLEISLTKIKNTFRILSPRIQRA
jgi:hypothetical protein